MTLPFAFFAVLTIASAVAAMSLRNLVHCAFALTATFAGLAAIYLQLNAQFVGFVQILIYIGAVAILIVFAILLTRGSEAPQESVFSSTWVAGAAVAVAIFGLFSALVLSSSVATRGPKPPPGITVRQIGDQLMGKYILPLEVLGLLLTAALIGAVIIAMQERSAD